MKGNATAARSLLLNYDNEKYVIPLTNLIYANKPDLAPLAAFLKYSTSLS